MVIETGQGDHITTCRAEILGNRQVARNLFRLRLALPSDWGPAEPGQFVNVTPEPAWEENVPGDAGGSLLRRPFSLAGVGHEGNRTVIEILYAVVGKVTRQMQRLPPRAHLDVLGPAGTVFPIDPGAHSLLVGGGRGIAPLLYLAAEQRRRKLPFTLVYGVRTAEEWAPLGPLARGALLTAEDGSGGLRGTVIDALEQAPAESGAAVMACGPHGMLHAVAKWAHERGHTCWVSVEEVFGCGVALCGGCAIPARGGDGEYDRYLWACRDGPVVRSERIDWEAWRQLGAATPPAGP